MKTLALLLILAACSFAQPPKLMEVRAAGLTAAVNGPLHIDTTGLMTAKQESLLAVSLYLFGHATVQLEQKSRDLACGRVKSAYAGAVDKILGMVGHNGARDTSELCSCGGALPYPCCPSAQWLGPYGSICTYSCCRNPNIVCGYQ